MHNTNQSGFTLLEIIITLAIVAILGMFASTYYTDSVKKARCTEGRTALLAGASALEKCKAVYGAYNNARCNIAAFLGDTPDGHFSVAVQGTATTFTLTATGQGIANAAGNPYCSVITLDHLGVQGGVGSNTW